MADINIINPYEDYQMLPLESESTYGDQLLNRVASLQVGFGSKVLRIDRDGLWLGAEDFASAPFSVDMDGNITGVSVDLSGYLQVGGSLADIQALIGDIGDISSDLGTISAGSLVGVTVTGGTVQTSSTGSRVVMDGASDSLKIYSGSTKRMELDADELRFYDSGGSLASTLHANGQALDVDVGSYGYLSVNFDNDGSPSGLFVMDTDTDDAVFYAGGFLGSNIVQVGGSNQVNLHVNGDITPTVSDSHDLGSSSYYWNRLYVDDIYFSGANPDIFDLKRILWGSSTSNPSGDGTMVYYDSGGTEGLRMQFGGADFQFDASGV